jgi:NAD(P)-dependent dehydrogenase (short-subunit alcohol dehydrogenase family)
MVLAQKCFVIIGGSSGLGLSAAKAFVKAGAQVVIVGRNEDNAIAAANLLGQNSQYYLGNASDETTATAAIRLCISTFGGFDGLYHVAGGSGRTMGDGPLHQLSLVGWQHTFDLNLTSLMLSNRAAINAFYELGHGGTVLNMSSVLGFSPSPQYFTTHAYAAAKSAVVGLTKSLAAYYAKDNIRFNLIGPGLVATPMSGRAQENHNIMAFIKTKQPLDGGRIGLAADLDAAAVYFMSDASGFTTGQTLYVDGGWEVSEGQY